MNTNILVSYISESALCHTSHVLMVFLHLFASTQCLSDPWFIEVAFDQGGLAALEFFLDD